MKKTKIVFLSLITIGGLLLSCNKPQSVDPTGDDPIVPAPEMVVTCTTDDASDITETTATLNGSVVFENMRESANIKTYFYYSETIKEAGKLVDEGIRVSASAVTAEGGNFSIRLEELNNNTTYYFVATVKIDGKDYVGEVKSFTTLEHIPEFTVTTCEADVSRESYVYLYAKVTSTDPMFVQPDTNPHFYEVVFYHMAAEEKPDQQTLTGYGVSHGNTWGYDSSNGYWYCIPYTSLDEGKHFFIPVVTAYGKTVYGEILSFTYTKPTPVLTSVETTDITFTSAKLSGVIDPSTIASTDVSIEMTLYNYTQNENPTFPKGTIDLQSGEFSFDIQDLNPATKYGCLLFMQRDGKPIALYEQVPGNYVEFTTVSDEITVTTGSPDTSYSNHIQLTAKVIPDDYRFKMSNITEFAFYYSKTAATAETLASSGTKAIAHYVDFADEYLVSIPKTELDGAYAFVPCATVNGKMTFGNIGVFISKKPTPVLTSVAVSNITTRTAMVSGVIDPSTIVSTDAQIYIHLNKESGVTYVVGTIDYQSGEFSFDLQNLDPGSKYEYYIGLIRDGKQFHLYDPVSGEYLSFATSAHPALTVSLSLPITMSATSTVNGKVSSNDPSFKYSDVGTCIVIVSPKAFTSPSNLDQTTVQNFPATYNSSTGAYTATLTGLDTRSTYYVMTAVTAYSKLFYSGVKKFSR